MRYMVRCELINLFTPHPHLAPPHYKFELKCAFVNATNLLQKVKILASR
jgi:hypothetical protein